MAMSFNRTESARFAQENQKIVGELHAGVDKALAEAASRGYAVAPGDTLATILFAGQAAKDKLTEVNGKIYEDRRKVLFEQDLFAMEMIVKISKLAMTLYAAELIYALTLEEAQNTALRDRGNADVIAMNAEVDKRQVAIIQARAEAERRVIALRTQLIATETATLPLERQLIMAQLSTAERKLAIIDALYKVLAAQKLVVAAEVTTMVKEEVLINVQLATAKKKLEIIDALYKVMEAERLVLAAERTTLRAEDALIDAKTITAEKKLQIIGEVYQVLSAENLVIAARTTTLGAEEELLRAQLVTAEKKLAIVGAVYQVLLAERSVLDAETITMTAEYGLITAQLATAEKKLEIINSIYQVLAAEELVLAAETRRAATLTLLLAAQMIVAGVKREMIPFYLEKASARMALAAAITAEIPITEAIINLGFDRIELKNVEEDAAHTTRGAEGELELYQAAWVRANKAVELTRTQSRRLLQEYANVIQGEILAKKKSLNEDGIDLELETSLARQTIGVDNEVAVSEHDVSNLTDELINILLNIKARASDEVAKVKASADTITKTYSTKLLSKKIIEGAF